MIEGKRIELTPSEKQGLLLYIKGLLADTGYYEEDTEESLADGLEKRLVDTEVLEDFIDSEEQSYFKFMQNYIQDLIVSQ
ncbi:hypothetical protein [Clostridium sp. 1001283B150210_160208_E6]|uniref:hypothetical protein n=1 Tax=Clostridium sp. 1001283B150210_160208_E6 TaxID=2787129 RepID=UPI0018AA5D91|nr:hypothetical protein [Clostridium sp. 1001283B150210_160208_E6]